MLITATFCRIEISFCFKLMYRELKRIGEPMLACGRNNQPRPDDTQEGVLTGVGRQEAARVIRSWLQKATLATGLAIGPHSVCLLGVGGVSGGGYLLHSWCSHSTRDLGIPLKRLSDIPENHEEFSRVKASLAAQRLLEAEPRFHQVIARKASESKGQPIQVIFLESGEDKRILVVFCKNGALCPCSKPELYEVGTRSSLGATESFPGQHGVIEALYFGR